MIAFLSVITLVFAGCGGSKPADVTLDRTSGPGKVGQTPAVGEEDEASSAPIEPPGTMEMPTDLTPAPSPSTPKATGGFEMPEQVSPNDAVSSSSQSTSNIGNDTDVKYATWDQILKTAKSGNRITVVDLWSLSCEPCLKEFPELVRLHQASGEPATSSDSVQCIAVNLDFDGRKSRPPQYYETQVASFLQSVGAEGFPTFICQTPSDEVFTAADIDSIPTVMIFSADGKLVKVFVDAGETQGFTYKKDVLPLLESLR